MKKECLKIAQHALLNEQGSVKSGVKNGLLRIYEQLSKSLATKPRKYKKPKTKKKGKELVLVEPDQIPEAPEKEEQVVRVEQESKDLLDQLV